ncbi:MAG: AAA family ATPase [Candidatus Brockarchaeota archaeon]|nr:AAA family ATPase [Candidatus Brockarchaeota archaeon]
MKTTEQEKSLRLKEVILEQFMSYRYARIPIRPKLNLILGPNGSGKSSILLGVSVGLGQSRSGRAEKLSDLIRNGEDIARVTLVFDNSPGQDGKRPVPFIRSDELIITRYLRRDGEYWSQINYNPATKMEIDEILSLFGIDPSNMLIIMHQYMIEEFAMLDPSEKLRLVEGAVGLSGLRDNIKASQERLSRIVSEEKSVEALLNEARETLGMWRAEYEKLVKKRELQALHAELNRLLKWSICNQLNAEKTRLEENVSKLEARMAEGNRIVSRTVEKYERVWSRLNKARMKLKRVFFKASEKGFDDSLIDEYSKLDEEITKLIRSYVKLNVKAEVLKYRIRELERERRRIQERIKTVEERVREAKEQLEGEAPKEVEPPDVLEKRINDCIIQIASLGTVSENAEELYKNYLNVYSDLEQKVKIIVENRRAAENELKDRIEIWRKKIVKTISRINEGFRRNMEVMGGIGELRLANLEDIENAGLMIFVSFGGSTLTEFNAYTQSGGERSATVVSFLMALQSLVKSSVRGIDELDVHMDPINRNKFFKILSDVVEKNPGVAYLCITPGTPPPVRDAHVIVVQKVQDESKILEVEQ